MTTTTTTPTTIDLSLFQHRCRHRQLAGSPPRPAPLRPLLLSAAASPPPAHLPAPLPHIVIAAVHVRALNVSLMVRRDLDRIHFHRAFKYQLIPRRRATCIVSR
jgi:hypothetical protein